MKRTRWPGRLWRRKRERKLLTFAFLLPIFAPGRGNGKRVVSAPLPFGLSRAGPPVKFLAQTTSPGEGSTMQACIESTVIASAPTQNGSVLEGFLRNQLLAGARALRFKWGWPAMSPSRAQMSLHTMVGLDSALAAALLARGIKTVGELHGLPKPVLQAAFGDQLGRELWQCVRSQK
jgi:hypothetical protein